MQAPSGNHSNGTGVIENGIDLMRGSSMFSTSIAIAANMGAPSIGSWTMNEDDMKERGLDEFDLIDITSFSRDGTTRTVYGYRAVRYEIPRGCAAGYMPELNVLCGMADVSTQSEQPITKRLVAKVTASASK